MTRSEAESIEMELLRTKASPHTLVARAAEAIRWLIEEIEVLERELAEGFFEDGEGG